ncbi:type I-F CRISPR-associated endoribonuclease Cas6/Csy4 [Limnohabitans sp. G3-2]|uniref:type I-F CRISPR-associated endoribonuclease Cas6/Csy4 n=1 Tax=Limnohabitans sp. G3-2 TaxID=1100711 RepID=UPI000C1F47E9|nr:type I-F CRISPR-associated endoribonuclease Cas6/Csy4 [Limnohabitans sp. G3-2]PIT76877.1 type I-F CRISPR-associated endoribonuclease Cas6/Csy4 [Limnohabitans sp. G3-2]
MNHYIDIHLRPDPEFPATVLLNALYAKLHKALVALATQSVGVSFPAHTKKHLGNVLRLHGSAADLTALQAQPWLGAMRELVQTSPIATVPATAQHRGVRRVQVQSSPERVKRRLVKRLMQREGISEAQAQACIHVPLAPKLSDPFINLQSNSTGGQRFRLFVRHGPIQTKPVSGEFGAYGLSSQATVPWF